jgi:hypothetical protein
VTVTRTHATVHPPRNCLVVRSAETSRLTGLRSIPVAMRQAAVSAFLRRVTPPAEEQS